MQVYLRGTVWTYTRQIHEKGVTYGTHPCIIISADEWNATHASVVVVPCTSKALAGTARNIVLNLPTSEGRIFPTQITTVSKNALTNFKGIVSESDMREIDNAIKAVLGLNTGIDLYSIIRERPEDDKTIHVRPDCDSRPVEHLTAEPVDLDEWTPEKPIPVAEDLTSKLVADQNVRGPIVQATRRPTNRPNRPSRPINPNITKRRNTFIVTRRRDERRNGNAN